jgi:putative hydroxymethylpyrimidine transporter CytX
MAGQFLGSFTRYFWILFFAAFCMLLSLGGPLVVVREWMEKLAIWLIFGLSLFVTYVTFSGSSQILSFQGDGSLPPTLAMDLVIAMPISWWPLISDYNRFSKNEKSAFLGTVAGYTFANFWFYVLGAALTLAFAGQTVIGSIMSMMLGGLALLALLVDEADNGFADIYSAAVSAQNILSGIRQWKLVTAVTVVSVAIAVLLPFQWQSFYQSFLLYIGAVFVPLLGVLCVDFYFVRKKEYRITDFSALSRRYRFKPLFAWLVGAIIYFVFYTTAIGSSIPSFVVSGIVLYSLERWS